MLQREGFRSKTLMSDLVIGFVDGLDSIIWCYTYATIIFAGALSGFIPLGLVILLAGWGLPILIMVARSRVDIHMAGPNEQAVILFGAIGALLVAHLGGDAATPQGNSTMLAVICLTGLLVAAALFLIVRLGLGHMLEMVPYPVVCGFMAGVVWLYLDAGAIIATGAPISAELWPALQDRDNLLKLIASIAGGGVLYFAASRIDESWVMPATFVGIGVIYYVVVWLLGVPHDALVAGGWMFDIDPETGGVGNILGMISFDAVDTGFVISVLPQIGTVVFLVCMAAVMEISILSATNHALRIKADEELKNNGIVAIVCALICSPPAHSDAIPSQIYKDIGATSRWMPIAASAVLLATLPFRPHLVTVIPVVLLGAATFMFAFQTLYDWVIVGLREQSNEDRAIIGVILATIVAFGLAEGVLLGLLVTALLFVVRYSFIPAVQRDFGVDEYRSSVERSSMENDMLGEHGAEARVVALRGFLFFGTSNTIREALFDVITDGAHRLILLDLRRVTGIDGSAMQVFRQIKQMCGDSGVELLYSGASAAMGRRLMDMGAVSERNSTPLLFPDLDRAVEWMENDVLERHAPGRTAASIDDYLADILGDAVKADRVRDLLQPITVEHGDSLFRQGDPDNGFYVLEHGSMTAVIEVGDGETLRVKRFTPGSLIGELSGYTSERRRTATVVADESCRLFHLDPARLSDDPTVPGEAVSAVHELVARTLGGRLAYMNRRLAKEVT